jgi:putative phage-type endonuclease
MGDGLKKTIWTEEELQQGSEAWHRWRKGEGEPDVEMTLGGSEIAPLMYMSPYATPLDVFNWKTGIEVKEFSEAATDAMDRGTLLEPFARAHYEKVTGLSVRTLCAIHPGKPWMRTSLDGITEDNSVILEIKSPRNLENHIKQTKGDKIPSYRWPQMQWQLAVMREHFENVERVDYVSFYAEVTEGEDGETVLNHIDMKVIPIHPNEAFITELTNRAQRFIDEHLRTGIPPAPTIFLEDSPLEISYPKPKVEGYWYPGMVPLI